MRYGDAALTTLLCRTGSVGLSQHEEDVGPTATDGEILAYATSQDSPSP